ncbi:MAG: hypothetical protein U0Q16_19450 [Bryobacteraceae bacterium]
MAPPPKPFEDLHAVPIHIRHIEARLELNAAVANARGEALLDFEHGSEDGCPVFDLRQPIEELSIDDEPVDVRALFHRDFGGGAWAHLRVIPRLLAAGSRHRMRIRYAVGHPAVPVVGGRQPGLDWVPGRRTLPLRLSDLGAGRYLRSWVPANLIFNPSR